MRMNPLEEGFQAMGQTKLLPMNRSHVECRFVLGSNGQPAVEITHNGEHLVARSDVLHLFNLFGKHNAKHCQDTSEILDIFLKLSIMTTTTVVVR